MPSLRALLRIPRTVLLGASLLAGATIASRADTPAGSPLPDFIPPVNTGSITLAKWLPGGGSLYVSAKTTYHLLADGSLDDSYTSHTFNQDAKAMLVQADGKVLLAGLYTLFDSAVGRPYLVRLQADGALDTSFPSFAGTGIQALAPGAGGKFYVGNVNGYGLLRYSADGVLDTTFSSPTIGFGQINGKVWAVKELADGRVMVAHQQSDNSTFGSVTGWYIQRLSSTGVVDPTFSATVYGPVTDFDVLSDGRIVIAGLFVSVSGETSHAKLAVLKADGSLDTTFNTSEPPALGDSDSRLPIVRVLDDKILLAGRFTTASGQTVGHLVRYNLDGTLDNTFAFGVDHKFNGLVASLEVTPDGDIFAAGSFTGFTGSTPATRWRAALLSGSAQVTAVPLTAPILGEPTNLTASSLTVHWTGSVAAVGYRVELATDALFTTGLRTADVGANVNEAAFDGLSSGTTYHVRVTATGATDASLTSEPGVATTTATAPVGPPAKQTISFPQPVRAAYGDAPLVLAATASSGLPVTYTVVSGPGQLSGDELKITGAGKITVRASQAGTPAFRAAASVSRTIVIDKAKLYVRADDAHRFVGEANPAFTLHYTGFVGEDTEATIGASKLPKPATKATKASVGGEYLISFTGGSSANYDFVLAPEPGYLTVQGFVGAYEALLFDPAQSDGEDSVPVGKLELTVAKNTLGYSGQITLSDSAKVVSVLGSLTPSLEAATADWTPTGTAAGTLQLSFTVAGDSLVASLVRPGRSALSSLGSGKLLRASDAVLAGAGAYTLSLGANGPLLDGENPRAWPLGSGYAAATIASKTGVLALKGKLADGATLTASVKPSGDNEYRLFVKPYGTARLDSFVGGALALESHPDTVRFPNRFRIPEGLLLWTKAALPQNAKTKDAGYRPGFGPLDLIANLDPWLPAVSAIPAKGNNPAVPAVTLARRLDLVADAAGTGTFAVVYPDDIDLGARAHSLPLAIQLNAKGVFIAGLPVGNPARWSLKISPTSGVYSGSFELKETPAAPAKPITRKVDFFGTLRQGESGDPLIGAGFFLIAPLPAATGAEKISAELRFEISGE